MSGDGHARPHLDRTATTLFLAAVVVFGAFWRVDVFIVDTLAVANALANLADGSLQFERIYYGPADARTPGVYVSDGRLYGRLYGVVVAALPVLLALRAVATVAAPGIVITGVWSVCLATLGVRLGRHLDDRRVGTLGLGLAGLVVSLEAVAGTVLRPRLFPLVALQTVTVLSAAGLVTTTYVLVGTVHDRRVGVAAAVATTLAGPVVFWATVPKRHVVVAFLATVTLVAFARSRRGGVRPRAAAYVPAGLAAWVSAPGGVLLLSALSALDVVTAPRNDARSLAVVGTAAVGSLLPFFVTNTLVSGNPLVPPPLLTSYWTADVAVGADPTLAASHPADAAAGQGPGEQTTPATTAAGSSSATDGDGAAVGAVGVGVVADALGRLVVQFERGVGALSPRRLYHVFVRSGRIPGVDYSQTGGETIDLTLLESAPVLGALLAVPFAALRSPPAGVRAAVVAVREDPRRATDALAVAFALLVVLFYLPWLPRHSTVTVRYLVPAVPPLVYAVAGLLPVRRVVRNVPSLVVAVALATTLGVGTAFLVAFSAADVGEGTLMQAHALSNLGAATLTAGWAVARPGSDRFGAVALGATLATMTLFSIGTGFEYFAADRHFLLPLGRPVETAIPIDP